MNKKTVIRKKQKNASVMIYFFAFVTVFLAFAAMAIDGTIIFTQRMKLQNITEMIALNAASEFNYDLDATASEKETQVKTAASNLFNILKNDNLEAANINVKVDTDSKKVLITTSMIARPVFLSALGISGINISALACAQSKEKYISAQHEGINWLTPSAAYISDILSKNVGFYDTAILLPLGQFHSASYLNSIVNFGLISSADNHPLSLGPGGFITIRLPAPIIDKPGEDLYVNEYGDDIEGYMVFAGIDKNPLKPYVQKDNEGDGILWKNISCAATPEKQDSDGEPGVYSAETELGTEDKIYGSAYFDLSNSCTGGISMVKYIRIVDDNCETGFVKNGSNFYKAMMYGESSSATSGADIDYVKVLNFVELVPSSGF